MTDEQKAVVAELMNRLPFVTWDRCVEYTGAENVYDDDLSVFGWIARDDGRSDFVELVWPTLAKPDQCGFSTSNAERSHEIADLLFGGHEGHLDCQRVRDVFGNLVAQAVTPKP